MHVTTAGMALASAHRRRGDRANIKLPISGFFWGGRNRPKDANAVNYGSFTEPVLSPAVTKEPAGKAIVGA